jgi:hypothetical protein
MFRLPIVSQTSYYNQQLCDFYLKLTKESINKYTKKIEENNSNKNKDAKVLMNIDSYVSNPNPNPNNNPYIIISCIGIFYFVSIVYSFLKSKK